METSFKPTMDGNGHSHVLIFCFEGKQYESHKQYLFGSELKELFKLSLDAELYLEIQKPWKDELILNNTEVDLARPGIEQFFVKKKLQYVINGKVFESSKQYIRVSKIREQGLIPDDERIFLAIHGPYDDELLSDDEWVDLARPGIEHFYSKKIDTKVVIIVNGSPVHWSKEKISFEEVILAAFGSYNNSNTFVYTVAYEDGPKANPEGSLFKGAAVYVKNKMIFHATATDKS